MDRPSAIATRQRVTNLIEEAGSLLGMIPPLLDENEQMRASHEQMRANHEQMRASHEQMRASHEQMRLSTERTQQEADKLRDELVAIKNEVAQHRTERDEITQMCTKAMHEAADVINEMLLKLRPGQKASPFARDPGTAVADLAPRPASAASSSI